MFDRNRFENRLAKAVSEFLEDVTSFDWRKKKVTNPKTGRKVQVGSLPSQEQEKYKPKKKTDDVSSIKKELGKAKSQLAKHVANADAVSKAQEKISKLKADHEAFKTAHAKKTDDLAKRHSEIQKRIADLKKKKSIPETKGFKGFDDPWKTMSPEDRREANRLQILALKAYPSSPKQNEIREKLNAILKKYGMLTKKIEVKEDLDADRKRLIHTVTDYDRKQQGKPGYNHYALAQYMAGVNDAIKVAKKSGDLKAALKSVFNDRLLDYLLKVV